MPLIVRYIRGAGMLTALLGLSVMIGWHARMMSFIQISPQFVPIQYNTALAFCLEGLGLVLVQGSRTQWLGVLCAFMAGSFAAVIGSQYVTGHDLGIDQLFIENDILVKTSYPGRMAPNTSLGFIMIAIALTAHAALKNPELRTNVIILFGTIVLVIGSTALLGYLVHVEAAYRWWSLSDMAPLTALGLVILSSGVLVLGCADARQEEQGGGAIQNWPPILAAVMGIAATLLVVQGLLVSDQKRAQEAVRTQAERYARIVETGLENSVGALFRMQDRLATGTVTPDLWERDARNYIRDNDSYDALLLLDRRRSVVRTVARRDDFDMETIIAAAPDERTLRAGKEPFLLRVVSRNTSRPVMALYFPLAKSGGVLAAAYNVTKTFSGLAGSNDRMLIRISDGKGVLYTNSLQDPAYPWAASETESIRFHGIFWRIGLIQDIAGYNNNRLIFLILGAGIVLSLSLANAIRQKGRISRYAAAVEASRAALEKSERRYALATEAAEIAVWDWDIEDKALVWTGRAGPLFGVACNDEIPTSEQAMLDMIPEDDRQRVRSKVLKSISNHDNFTVDYRMKRLDDREVWVQSRGNAVEWRDGHAVRISGTLTDITRQKAVEQELRRSNRELEKFAYIAAHDLRSPLRGIDNLALWVMDDAGSALPEEARKNLELLRGRIARLDHLLSGILMYAQAGRITGEIIPVDSASVVRTVADLNLPSAFTVEAKELPVLRTSRTLLEQIFSNLFSNAVKHHDKGRGIIRVSATDHGAFHEFIVADDGPGIPAEYHEKVFEMFQTLKSRDKVEGSGLGMSIVKKLVEWQGGKIWIESRQGQRGMAVHFTWPKTMVAPNIEAA